ncbi:lactadherin-like isoform X2 [Argiope bruennichi]|uniref:lactadherin-like isoform X2 n=1 Tax=Argiope bruennichi TaxID=94029 RepID=UPI002494F2EA|nr:lactadherin-like isoform X2 [Argiope bruennichi]
MLEKFLLVILLCSSSSLCFGSVTGCSSPLGLMTGAVQDWQISVSSMADHRKDPGCHMRYGRIYQPPGRAWCAGRKAAMEWIQVDLGVSAIITGMMTQGRGDGHQWVTSYLLSYSLDAYHWKYCSDVYGNRKVFKGNIDSHSTQTGYLDQNVTARFLRLHVLQWHEHPSMRIEVLGCQDCNSIISVPPQAQLTASSSRPWSKQGTCTPEDAHIFSFGGWCAKTNDMRQWLQIDLGPPTRVTGVVTKGRGDSRRKQWVTSFALSYSNSTNHWHYYKDDNLVSPKEFGGNMDKNTERRHYFNQPFTARYVRVHPMTWRGRVSMRLGLIGCQLKGECGQGFFRVHTDSECVENLAYKKDTWVNDKRHSWNGWKDGHSSYAVDGDEDTHLRRCAILDNYYVDYPVWMVDLGQRKTVRGVVITTWQGRGEDRTNVYKEYIYNLEKLTVFVENKARLETSTSGSKCASISRLNNALFRRTLHFECPDHLIGRYVYVKAYGVPRWNRLYSAILCEVRVY